MMPGEIDSIVNENQDSINKNILNPLVYNKISDFIFALIPEVTRLRELFLCWTVLNPEQKAIMDSQANNGTHLVLYKPLMEAMHRWEKLQDTQGAPGCDPGLVTLNGDPQLEQALVSAVYTAENVIEKIQELNNKEIFKSLSATELTCNFRSTSKSTSKNPKIQWIPFYRDISEPYQFGPIKRLYLLTKISKKTKIEGYINDDLLWNSRIHTVPLYRSVSVDDVINLKAKSLYLF